MKKLCWLAATGWFAASALAQVPPSASAIKPIESLWLTSPQLMKAPQNEATMAAELKRWRKVFDRIMLLKLPPTFADDQDFAVQANALIKDAGGDFVLVTLPVGNEGWESSANRRLAERQGGGHYDPSKAMSESQWMETLKPIDSGTWTWILEQPAQMPTPEQAAKSAADFVAFAKARHKQAAIWLSAEAFRNPRFTAMTRRVCEATRSSADFYGWMDMPVDVLRSGEDKWRESLDGLLDQILALTPKEKTIIQWSHLPNSLTKDIPGTIAYITACQAKGINHFCLLSGPQFLGRSPWHDFYQSLPKAR